jgi:diaminohydroxyphosphoribosylaminopyrimidine deaminase/5-amino-6-(5-phosphoribosylamino)uracil reductase
MSRALKLAERGLETADPNPRVGCVLVRAGEIVGEGWHRRAGEAHAEIETLASAGERARGATAYVTLEPCVHHGRTPPCTAALIAAGVNRVVAAMPDPDPRVAGRGFAALEDSGVAVDVGLMEAEARALNRGFISRMTLGRPFVRLKLAASVDGRTALASGESRWITGEAARRDVHRWRARSSAVLTGIGTVLADDPSLTVRLDGQAQDRRQPLRIVLDSGLRTPPKAKLLNLPGRALILTSSENTARRQALESSGADVVALTKTGDGLDLQAVLDRLAKEQCNEVMVEAGSRLSGALLAAGLVDELLLYFAPCVLGDTARGMFRLPELTNMDERHEFEVCDARAIGADWRFTLRPRPKAD